MPARSSGVEHARAGHREARRRAPAPPRRATRTALAPRRARPARAARAGTPPGRAPTPSTRRSSARARPAACAPARPWRPCAPSGCGARRTSRRAPTFHASRRWPSATAAGPAWRGSPRRTGRRSPARREAARPPTRQTACTAQGRRATVEVIAVAAAGPIRRRRAARIIGTPSGRSAAPSPREHTPYRHLRHRRRVDLRRRRRRVTGITCRGA